MKTKDELHEEVLGECAHHKCCSLNISMGAGKTRLALRRIAQLPDDAKVFVAIPIKGLAETWKKEANENGFGYLLDDITFDIYKNLHKYDSSKFRFVVFDEIHKIKGSHQSFLEGCAGILGLTGTKPPQHSDAERLIDHYCPFIFDYLLDDAISDGMVNDYEITVHSIPLSDEKTIERTVEKTGATFHVSEKNDYEYRCGIIVGMEKEKDDLWRQRPPNLARRSEQLNKALGLKRIARVSAIKGYEGKSRFVQKLLPSIGDRTIIFANTKSQADKLCPHSHYSGNKHSDDNTALFNTGGIQVLSCVEQLSIGVNLVNAKNGIIMHLYSGNSDKGRQRMGRLLRLNPNDKCHLHVICYKNTVDETWVRGSLADLDQSKITWIDH
jgi:superfamily II DNA or RNA helicase